MKKFLILGALLTWLVLGPVQDAILAVPNPLDTVTETLDQTQQSRVDSTCEAARISTGDTECGIELRSPAELTATAGQG